MKKQDTTRLIDDLVQTLRRADDLAGARRVQGPRLPVRHPGGHHDLQERRRRRRRPSRRSSASYERELAEIEDQYDDGPDHPGGAPRGGHRAVGPRPPTRSAEAMVRPPRRAQPDLHDGQLGRPRLVLADPPAGRDARPDGQPEGRDHRAPDQGQLHGGPDRARVLHLDPRRPQGPRRHGAAHRRLGLPDPASGRRRPGRDHPRGGLRHRGVHRDAGVQARGRSREPARCGRPASPTTT